MGKVLGHRGVREQRPRRNAASPGLLGRVDALVLDHGILAHRGALGIDTFGPDIGADKTFAVSKLLYREHRLSLEVLANLADLPARDFTVVVGGFITENGSGSPASIYTLI